MDRKRRVPGRRAWECSAVLAAGMLTTPSAAAELPSTTDLDRTNPPFEEGECRQEQASLQPESLSAMSGLDRTDLVCRAACSPVEAIRFAAARALARPVHAVGEELALVHLLADSSKRVRAAAKRAALARGFDLSPNAEPTAVEPRPPPPRGIDRD